MHAVGQAAYLARICRFGRKADDRGVGEGKGREKKGMVRAWGGWRRIILHVRSIGFSG